ncbi:hypothetical protein GCM10028805_19140 [Spirosoma harenae]
MKATAITSCYIGPELSPEQFISEHFFLYLGTGNMTAYDGNKEYKLKAGECGLARRNHLVKYNKQLVDGKFEKIVVVFDQKFLKAFQEEYKLQTDLKKPSGGLIKLEKNPLVDNYVRSLDSYLTDSGKIDPVFFDIKRKELLLIVLRKNPELASVFFDFSAPEKIDLEAYMNRNFRFNVTLDRFAYLTGRSLTIFKQDFKRIFQDTPSHWLMQKRLQEAYFLLTKKERKVSDVYLEVGFENLSHFSFAFKKKFGYSPTSIPEEWLV